MACKPVPAAGVRWAPQSFNPWLSQGGVTPNVDMDGVNRLSVTRVERPMLLFHSPKDEVVSIRLSRPVVYEPTVTYMPLFGEHGDVRPARRPAIRWLTRGAAR